MAGAPLAAGAAGFAPKGAHPMPQEPRSGWQLADSSAAAYERYLVPAIFAPMAERVLSLAGVVPAARVLDVGCGTGIVARLAATRVGPHGAVTGLDLNDGMLQVARRTSIGASPEITWRQGDAVALPFDERTFDVIACQQALQFMPRPAAALAEMRRVLSECGRAVVAVLRPIRYAPAYGPIADALQRHAGDAAATMMRSPFPDWDGARLRALLAEARFRDVRVRIDVGAVRYPSVADMLAQEAASSPLAAELAHQPATARVALVDELTAALREFQDDDGVVFPMETFVAIGRR